MAPSEPPKKKIDSIKLFYDISIAPKLREKTRSGYAQRLQQMEKICAPSDLEEILMNPEKTMEKLRESGEISTPGAMANAVGSVLGVFKNCLTNGEFPKSVKERWSRVLDEVKVPAKEDFESGKIKTTMQWSIIWDKNEELYEIATRPGATKKEVAESLMLLIYVDMEPRRHEDYLRLYIKKNKKPSPETSYIDMTLAEPMIYVSMYKTSDSLDTWSRKLPERFLTLLKISLKHDPREYVFAGYNGLPYKTAMAWSKYHNIRLRKWFGEGSTIVGMRHARSTSISEDLRYSFLDRKHMAKDMGHGASTNILYAQKTSEEDNKGVYETARYSSALGEFTDYKCIPVPKKKK